MRIQEIDQTTLDAHNASSPYVHYMKSSMWASFKQQLDHFTHKWIGFYHEDEFIGTAMVLFGQWLGYRYAYVPTGPNIDYTSQETIHEVFNCLKEYANQNGVLFLRVDPNVIRMHRDIEGNPIEDGFNNEFVTNELIQCGYTHKGYGYAYDGSWTNRYTLMVDLSPSMEEIVNRYSKQRKNSLNRHKINGIHTYIGSKNDIDSLMEFELMLSKQEGFTPHSKQFFESLLDCFGDKAVIYVTEINLDSMILGIQEELNSKKYAKDLEARQAKEQEIQNAEELKKEYGNIVKIATGLFIRIGNKSWDLYTYNHKAFNAMKPVDNLHRFAMEDMKNHGVQLYDMCGFSGVTNPEDPYYGLYAYKRSFSSFFVEQIGEFDYIRDSSKMNRYRFLQRVYNRIHRAYVKRKYTK